MATPTSASRKFYACGSEKCANWGTANAVGANDEILALEDGGFARIQAYEQHPAINQIVAKSGSLGLIGPCDFSPPVHLQYQMGAWGKWLAAIFGTAGVPANNANCFTHTFQWADEPTDFFTVVQERPGHIWECPSAMPYKVVISPDGSKIKAVASLRGNTIKDDSAVNTDTQVDALTPVSRETFVNFTHGQFLMNAQGGTAFNSTTDAVEISDFEVSLERQIDGIHVLGSQTLAQPVEGAIPVKTLKLTLPHASNTNVEYFANFTGENTMKAQLAFTGAAINANGNYSFTLYFPRLVFAGPPEASLEDIIKCGLTFIIQEANAAPTGMNYARVYCKVVNAESTDYLA